MSLSHEWLQASCGDDHHILLAVRVNNIIAGRRSMISPDLAYFAIIVIIDVGGFMIGS